MEYGPYRARVRRVLDGDTVELRVDLGFDIHHDLQVRLTGHNAPEDEGASKVPGAAWTAQLRALLAPESAVLLYTKKARSGKAKRSFVRYIGRVVLDDGTDVSAAMLAWAVATHQPS
jgi:endonuclease YncB( thermonuclease family)